MINKLKNIIKKYKKSSILAALIILGGVIFFIVSGDENTGEKIVKVQFGTVAQEVSATGRVESSRMVDLSLDRSGRVVVLAVETGDKVRSGQLLLQLESSELIAQKQRELANISSAEAKLNQVLALADGSDLNDSLAISVISSAFKAATDAMVDFTKIQYAYFSNATGEANSIADAKEQAMQLLYGQPDLGRVLPWYFLSLNSGLKKDILDAENGVLAGDLDALMERMRDALLKTKFSLELLNLSLSNTSEVSVVDSATIKTDIDFIISQLSNLKTKNKSLQSEIFNVQIAQAQLDQAKANLALIEAQIAKNFLRAPFAGVITNVDVELGEITGGAPVISMISNDKYQIEVNISEADINKIKVGNTAIVKFDAYGSDAEFEAAVVHINPAASITSGIAAYGVTLEFAAQDSRVLPGLTADIDIQTNKKENVLYVPSRNVINREGKKYVIVLAEEDSADDRFANLSLVSESKMGKTYEVEIQTGLKGSDGKIEVISGLKDGDQIISN
ncbi:MAG: efflux RND transporter periplasmic adaptor subunit [Patescibacteria group bacterium]